MSAFNYVVFEDHCPACGQYAQIRAQTHIASDYEGDMRGRFMDREYRLGEAMWWFSPSHPDYDTWKTWGGEENRVTEDCYAVCTLCNAALSVVIMFENVVVERIVSISPIASRSY